MNIEKVIEEVKEARKGPDKPYIFDENGNVAKDMYLYDILPLLDQLKRFERPMPYDSFEEALNYAYENGPLKAHDNTYNYLCNISNDIEYISLPDDDIAVFRVHLKGDVRGDYSTPVCIDLKGYPSFVGILCEECDTFEAKEINDGYIAQIDALSSSISIVDKDGEEFCTSSENERDELIREIKENLAMEEEIEQ